MLSLRAKALSVKPSNTLQMNEERTVRVRKAIGLVRAAPFVALAVHLNSRNQSIIDVPRTTALRVLRQVRDRMGNAVMVEVADVFGTLVIGACAPAVSAAA